MSRFLMLFILEAKRFFSKKTLLLLVPVLLLFFYGVNKGINDYRETLDNAREFQEIDAVMFSKLRNYTHYGFYGIHVFYTPSASSIFFTNSGVMAELSAHIDSVVGLKVYHNRKGKPLFKNNSASQLRLSGLILLLGTLFALFTGYEAMRGKEYLKFLSSTSSPGKILAGIIMSRMILLSLIVLLIFGAMLGVTLLNDITFAPTDYSALLGYLLSTLLLLLFFLIAGCLTGLIQSRLGGISVLLMVWIAFMFIAPAVVDSIITEKSDNLLSSYKIEREKHEIMNQFENASEEVLGEFERSKIELERENIEWFWKEWYKKLEAIENNLKDNIANIIHQHNNISLILPTSFYSLTASEVSSRGYGNFIAFLNYINTLRRQFVRFYIDRCFYHDPNQLVSFIKGDENLFKGSSRIPGNFGLGAVINLGSIFLLGIVVYIRFKRWLFVPAEHKPFKPKDRQIQIRNQALNVLYTSRPALKDYLYNLFAAGNSVSRDAEPALSVKIEDREITGHRKTEGFIYICHPSKIPGDITVDNFISFILRTNNAPAGVRQAIYKTHKLKAVKHQNLFRIDKHDQAELLLAVLPYIEGKVLLIDQAGRGMAMPYLIRLKDTMEGLAQKGISVIYLTPDKYVDVLGATPARELFDLPNWASAVESHRGLTEEETESQ